MDLGPCVDIFTCWQSTKAKRYMKLGNPWSKAWVLPLLYTRQSIKPEESIQLSSLWRNAKQLYQEYVHIKLLCITNMLAVYFLIFCEKCTVLLQLHGLFSWMGLSLCKTAKHVIIVTHEPNSMYWLASWICLVWYSGKHEIEVTQGPSSMDCLFPQILPVMQTAQHVIEVTKGLISMDCLAPELHPANKLS